MKRRYSKKKFSPGTLITVQGTSCVFMSLGMKTPCELDSFNGFDLSTGNPVAVCNGRARLSTKKERTKYWNVLKNFVKEKVK